jgi:hypothetical protein
MTRIVHRETGICFDDWEVRATRAGTKTQKLELIKPQPEERPGLSGDGGGIWWRGRPLPIGEAKSFLAQLCCPFQVGMRLWVKEAWKEPLTEYHLTGKGHGGANDRCVGYRSTMTYKCGKVTPGPESIHTWKSSYHMPKWAARLWLETVGVRVERVERDWAWAITYRVLEPQRAKGET